MTQPFNSDIFRRKDGSVDIDGLNGYIQALNQLMVYLMERANAGPEFRIMEPSTLLAMIREAMPPVIALLNEQKAAIENFNFDKLFASMGDIAKEDAKTRYGIDLSNIDEP